MGSAVEILKKDRWRGEREDETCEGEKKATVWFGWTRKWGELRLHGCNERRMWTCMFSSFCSQSVTEKSILINSISNSSLREQENYEGKRMPSDTCNEEKSCLLLCPLFSCGAADQSWSELEFSLHDHWCQKRKVVGIWQYTLWWCKFSFCFRFLTNEWEYWNVMDVWQVCFWLRELLPHFSVLPQFSSPALSMPAPLGNRELRTPTALWCCPIS